MTSIARDLFTREQHYQAAGWAEERDDSNNLIRPWACNFSHPLHDFAIRQAANLFSARRPKDAVDLQQVLDDVEDIVNQRIAEESDEQSHD